MAQLYAWSRGPLDVIRYAYLFLKERPLFNDYFRLTLSVTVALWYWLQWVLTSAAILILVISMLLGRPLALAWAALYAAEIYLVLSFVCRTRNLAFRPLPLVGQALCFSVISSIPAVVALWDIVAGVKRQKYKSTHRSL